MRGDRFTKKVHRSQRQFTVLFIFVDENDLCAVTSEILMPDGRRFVLCEPGFAEESGKGERFGAACAVRPSDAGRFKVTLSGTETALHPTVYDGLMWEAAVSRAAWYSTDSLATALEARES